MAFIEALGGAVVGAAASVTLQQWAKRRRQPSLDVQYVREDDLAPPFSEDDLANGARVSYLFARPRVCARNGRDSAHGVQVILTGCTRVDSEAQPQYAKLLLGRPLKWSDVDGNELNVPPGVCRRFDLVHVRRRSSRAAEEPLELTLDIYPRPRQGRHRLPAGRYAFDVALVAQDIPSQFCRFTVELRDEMRGELRTDMLIVSLDELGNHG